MGSKRAGVLAAVVLGATAAGAFVPASAQGPTAARAGAGECRTGVTVVLEPGALTDEDPLTRCVTDGAGDSAADLVDAAGWPLDRVSSAPQFVCRIDGLPAESGCAQVPPVDAYWSLWWSDGESEWSYANLGVDSQTVPAGGAVAFTWVDGSDDGRPETPVAGTTATAGDTGSSTAEAAPAQPSDGEEQDEPGGLPAWVPPVVILVLGLGIGAVVLRRRRS